MQVEYAYISLPAEFGASLRSARMQLGLSQAEVAQASGCSQRFVSQLERGKETAELGKALQVAAALGLRLRLDNTLSADEKRERLAQDIARIASPPRKRRSHPKLAEFLGEAG